MPRPNRFDPKRPDRFARKVYGDSAAFLDSLDDDDTPSSVDSESADETIENNPSTRSTR